MKSKKRRRDELAQPIHGVATDEIDRRRNTAYMTKVFKKAAGLGRKHPPVDSTFSLPAKKPGGFSRVLTYGENYCSDVRGRFLKLDGRPLPPSRSRTPHLVTMRSRPPKKLKG